MASSENKSEVARIRKQIDEEYEAMQRVLEGPTVTSRHDFIAARMNNVDQHLQQLIPLVGREEAINIVIEVNDAHAPSQRNTQGGTNGK